MVGRVGERVAEMVFRLLCRFVMVLVIGFIFFLLLSLPTPLSRVAAVGDDEPVTPPRSPETVALTIR